MQIRQIRRRLFKGSELSPKLKGSLSNMYGYRRILPTDYSHDYHAANFPDVASERDGRNCPVKLHFKLVCDLAGSRDNHTFAAHPQKILTGTVAVLTFTPASQVQPCLRIMASKLARKQAELQAALLEA